MMMTYEEHYAQIRTDNPEMAEYHVRVNALQVAHLERENAATRRNPPRPVRLVPEQGGFVNALFGAIDTTGRMPVVKAKEKEEGDGEAASRPNGEG
jgi:hypothetical protein